MRKANSESGSAEKATSGGSKCSGALTIATHQPMAASEKTRFKPSASQGSQPATKW